MVNGRWFLALLVVSLACTSVAVAQQSDFKVGDKVEARVGANWKPAEVVGVNANGWLKVKVASNSGRFLTPTLPPRLIRRLGLGGTTNPSGNSGGSGAMPPDNPFASKRPAAALKGERIWTDSSGTFTVKAEFVELKSDIVHLKKTDGEVLEVPLDRLGKADQDLIRQALGMASAGGAPSTPTADRGTDNDISAAYVEPNLSTARNVILDAPSVWSLQPDPLPTVSSLPQAAISLAAPVEKSIFEKAALVGFQPEQGIALIGRVYAPPGKPKNVRLERVDLKSGRSAGFTQMNDDTRVIDVDPTGKRLLVRNDFFGFGKNSRLYVFDLSSGSPTLVSTFEPFTDSRGKKKDVGYAKLLDTDHLLTHGEGKIIVWKIPSAEAVYQINVKAAPALNASRKFMAITTDQGMFVAHTKDGSAIGSLAGEQGAFPKFAFNDDGSRLAMYTHGSRLQVWDCEKGERIRDIFVQGGASGDPMDWMDREHILLGKTLLVDVPRRMSLWRYNGIETAGQLYGGYYWCVTKGGTSGKSLAPFKLPHQEARQFAAGLTPEELLVLKPGVNVRLTATVSNAPSFRPKILDVLARRLDENDIRVTRQADLTLEAISKPGKRKTMTYEGIGFRGGGSDTVSYTPQVYQLVLKDRQGKVLWQAGGGSSAPPILHLNQGQSAQQAVAEYTKPRMTFFENTPLPRFIARAGKHQGAFGVSTLSSQGIQTTARP